MSEPEYTGTATDFYVASPDVDVLRGLRRV